MWGAVLTEQKDGPCRKGLAVREYGKTTVFNYFKGVKKLESCWNIWAKGCGRILFLVIFLGVYGNSILPVELTAEFGTLQPNFM